MRVPFETDNKYALRDALSSRVAPEVLDLLAKNRSLMSGSGKFTHKCSCPNPEHKSGKERSASFYFSKDTGHFFCFGCSIFGNSFDLLKLLGEDPEAAFKKALEGGPVEVKEQHNTREYTEKALGALTKKVRQKLQSLIGTDDFQTTFSAIQDFLKHLDKIIPEIEGETLEQIHGRFLQLNMEFKRKFK